LRLSGPEKYRYHPSARFTAKFFVEDQCDVGYNMVGFGIPHWLSDGGESDPGCVMSSQSIWIGDEQPLDVRTLVRPQATFIGGVAPSFMRD
jgi:hypothetical protein